MILLSNTFLETMIAIFAMGVFITVAKILYAVFHKSFFTDKNDEVKNEVKKDFKIGYVKGEVYKVIKKGNSYPLFKLNDERVGTLGASKTTREAAFNEGKLVQAYINKNGKKIYRKVDKKQ